MTRREFNRAMGIAAGALGLSPMLRGRSIGSSKIGDALSSLRAHLDGSRVLEAGQIARLGTTVVEEADQIAADPAVLSLAFDVSDLYEARLGPLFIHPDTKGGIPREPKAGLEIHYALFAVQQALLDHAYTPESLTRNATTLNGRRFLTSTYFPGAAAPPADPRRTLEARINASQPEDWGFPVMFFDQPARRPTGIYVPPGCLATVAVPPSLVSKGFAIRVGAHSWNLANKPRIKRLDRVSLVFPIASTSTKVANPLGGGLYIEVPYRADAGIVTVRVANAVRSPFFSARSFDRTKLDEWMTTEREHPGPWADFESDKFMMQVPSAWVRDLEDAPGLMQDWDASMDACSELLGLRLVRPKTVLYMQNDVLYRGSANFPGYPMSNDPYDPDQPPPRNRHYMLRGPQFSKSATFHELGHASAITKFKGETESAVNLLYVAVLNRKFGVDLDEAFRRSLDGNPGMTRDHAAITWMVTEHFRNGEPMDASEMMYQHRGHAKYVDIAALFGWEALHRFWHSVQLDCERGITYPKNADPPDSRILRMSKAAGADLTPLIHFWGVHPERPDPLKAQIADAELKPSGAVRELLLHYLDLIPMSEEAYLAHFNALHPRGRQPKDKFIEGFGEAQGLQARKALQFVLDRYYPGSRS